MSVIITTPAKLPGQIKALQAKLDRTLVTATHRAALRGVAFLKTKTPVDQGELRAAWRVSSMSSIRQLARIINDAPHAGIVELGARPHKVSRAGWEAIYAWVWRHRVGFGMVTPSGRGRTAPQNAPTVAGYELHREVSSITWAIVKRLQERGQKPTYFIKLSLPELRDILIREVQQAFVDVSRRDR